MKIACVGLGRLGLPCALAMEHYGGHDVVGVEPNAQTVAAIEARAWPHREAQVPELLGAARIRVVGIAEAVAHAEVIFVAVQTPHRPEFEGVTPLPEGRADFDYTYLRQAVGAITRAALEAKKPLVVSVISTVLPGTMAREIVPLLNQYTRLVYNPSFIAMGTTIADFIAPEFLLLGGDDADAIETVERVYAPIHQAPHVRVRIVEAELIKVLYNAFIGFKIQLANAAGEICDTVGADADAVMGALCLARTRLISTQYLSAGMGDSGHCLPAGELVFTEDGPLPIESIEPGMRVLARDGRLHAVVKRHERKWSGELVSVQTWGAPPVRFTFDHPLLVSEDQRPMYMCKGRLKHETSVKVVELLTSEIERSAAAVRVGDFLPMTIPVDEAQVEPPAHATEDYIELAGYYLSNGSLELRRNPTNGTPWSGRINFSMHLRAARDHDRIAELCLRVSPPRRSGRGVGAIVSKTIRPPLLMAIRYGSAQLADLLERDFGRGAASKRLPSWIVYGPRRLIEKVIIGMWRGDGCAYPQGMHFSTASPHLAYGMQLMLARVGIPTNVCKIAARLGVHKGSFGRVPTYEVSTGNAKHVGRLSALVGMPAGHPGKVQKLYDRYPERDGAFMRPVREIKREKFSGMVYNLWVETDHTFTTPIGTVHNCHPRDQIALSWLARSRHLSSDPYSHIMEARERHADWVASLVSAEAHRSGLPIIFLGMAYKPETDLTGGSASRLTSALVQRRGLMTNWHDPHIEASPVTREQVEGNPGVFVHATAHRDFQGYVLASGSVVVDPWGTLPPQANVRYVRPGRMPREIIG